MTIDQRRLRLIGWLDVITNDVQWLLIDQHIFYELQKIVRQNPQFAECDGLFTRWMASGFAQASAVGIRRQARYDKRYPDNISLVRFLNEVKDDLDLITRQYYLDLYKAQNAPIEIGENDFDKLAGAGNARLPKTLIEGHIDELKSAADAVATYVNRRIAHYDDRGAVIPTFGDLSAALATMEKIALLYNRLLKGPMIMQLLPTFQYDWTAIFRFAWLNPDRSD